MSDPTLKQQVTDAITSLVAHEGNVSEWVNGDTSASYTTSGGDEVPSIRKFIADSFNYVGEYTASTAYSLGQTFRGATSVNDEDTYRMFRVTTAFNSGSDVLVSGGVPGKYEVLFDLSAVKNAMDSATASENAAEVSELAAAASETASKDSEDAAAVSAAAALSMEPHRIVTPAINAAGVVNAYPGAKAAYSTRNLDGQMATTSVVNVRRASDNKQKDFTARDILDGAMLNWVNADVDTLPLDSSNDTGLPIGTQMSYFDGTVDTSVDLANDIIDPSDNEFTLEFNFKCETIDAGDYKILFSNNNQAGDAIYILLRDYNQISIRFGTTEGLTVGGLLMDYKPNVVHKLVLSARLLNDVLEVTVFLDDELVVKSSLDTAFDTTFAYLKTSNFYIGRFNTIERAFKGFIYDVKSFDQYCEDGDTSILESRFHWLGYGDTPWKDLVTGDVSTATTPKTAINGPAAAYSLRNLCAEPVEIVDSDTVDEVTEFTLEGLTSGAAVANGLVLKLLKYDSYGFPYYTTGNVYGEKTVRVFYSNSLGWNVWIQGVVQITSYNHSYRPWEINWAPYYDQATNLTFENRKTKGKFVTQVRRASDDKKRSFTAAEVAGTELTDWVNGEVALPLDTTGHGLKDHVNFSNPDTTYYTCGSDITIGANATWKAEVEMVIDAFADYVFPFGDNTWGPGAGLILYSNGNVKVFSKNTTATTTGINLGVPFNVEYGHDGNAPYVRLNGSIVYGASGDQSGSRTTAWKIGGGGSLADNPCSIHSAKLTVNDVVVRDYQAMTASSTLTDSSASSEDATLVGDIGDVTDVTVNYGPAAAYSLRDLSVSRADLTSSGDTTSETTGALVAQVRRSSDDEIKSFTAAEVAGGSLETWVNAVTATQDCEHSVGFQGGPLGTATASGGGRTKTYVFTGATTGESILYRTDYFAPTLVTDATSTLSFTITGLTGGSVEIYRTSLSGTRLAEITSDGSYTVPFTGSGSQENMYLTVVGTSVDFTLSAWYATHTLPNDGYVSTWYDQSGNDNHAVQATPASQPKVVEGGVLVTDGLKFDGVDDNMDTSHVISATSTIFGVCQSDTASDFLLDMRDGGTDGVFIRSANNDSFDFQYNSVDLSGASGASGVKLGSFLFEDGSQKVWTNGVEVASDTASGTIDVTTTTQIGGRSFSTPLSGLWLGTIGEIIIYDSDQTDNRKAIESNMADYHGNIDLPAGFDSGNDEVDGYVATWYDQSGNGNNAVQAVATSQPKIVDGGVLVTDGLKFDGGQSLVKTAFTQGQLSQPNTAFAVSKILDVGNVAYVIDSANASGRNMLYATSFYYRFHAGTAQEIAARNTDQHLFTALYNATNSDAYVDGVIEASSVDVGTQSMSGITIGARFDLIQPLIGTISEIIIYDSDQTDNRTAIESNMAVTYDIDMLDGYDPGNDKVDGYVTTWYDQSGYGNHATQDVATSQPKIVEEGNYLGLIRTDNVNGFFNTTNTIDFNSGHSLFASYADDGGDRFSLVGGNATTGHIGWSSVGASDTSFGMIAPGGNQSNVGFALADKTQRTVVSVLWNNESTGWSGSVNGAYQSVPFNVGSTTFISDTPISISTIGKGGNAIGKLDLTEIIIYDSDQSNQRINIEDNLAVTHDITLARWTS